MNNNHPLHLAIIPDGNRRWAKTRGLLPWNGHERAVGNFRGLTDWCRDDPRIGTLTVWCFSTENWKRDPSEVSSLMRIYEDYLCRERPTFTEKKTRLLHSGRRERIPASLSTLIREIEEETADNTEFTLHLAVDYGGKDEIIRAANRVAAEVGVTEDTFRNFLDQPSIPDIDIVLRTSGEQRTSNFFLWQSAYAEWIFIEKLFPDLTTNDLVGALEEYAKRKRRFGS